MKEYDEVATKGDQEAILLGGKTGSRSVKKNTYYM